MRFEADEAVVVEQDRGDEGCGEGGAGEDAAAELLRDGEADDGGDDGDEAAEPGPPGDLCDAAGGGWMAQDELQQQDAGEAAGVDEEGRPDGGGETFVELGVETGLKGIGGAGGEREEEKEPGHEGFSGEG